MFRVPQNMSWSDGRALVCSLGGIGYLKRGPATAGALVGGAAYFVLKPPLALALLILAATAVLGAVLSQKLIDKVGVDDPQFIVLDEFAGVWAALAGLDASLGVVVAGTVLFRLFDKFKFGPAAVLDRRGDGAGLMLDDVVAGLYANILLRTGLYVYAVVS